MSWRLKAFLHLNQAAGRIALQSPCTTSLAQPAELSSLN